MSLLQLVDHIPNVDPATYVSRLNLKHGKTTATEQTNV